MQINQLKERVAKQFPFLSETEISLLLNIGHPRQFKNKELLLELGKPAKSYFYIIQGMVRGVLQEDEDEEHTIFLKPENTFITAPEALKGSNLPTRYALQAIGPTTVLELPVDAFEELTYKYPSIAKVYIAGMKEAIATLIFRVELLSQKMPEERYEALLDKFPQFFQQAYNKYIANYLGITPTSLSRIIRRKKSGS